MAQSKKTAKKLAKLAQQAAKRQGDASPSGPSDNEEPSSSNIPPNSQVAQRGQPCKKLRRVEDENTMETEYSPLSSPSSENNSQYSTPQNSPVLPQHDDLQYEPPISDSESGNFQTKTSLPPPIGSSINKENPSGSMDTSETPDVIDSD